MAPQRWASPEEEEFVNTFYKQYQQCQARRDYSTFWKPFYEAWGAKFPEWVVVFPHIPLDEALNEEPMQVVSKVYEEQKLQLINKLRNNWGSSKALCKAVNNGEKTRQKVFTNITAPPRAHSLQSHKAYSKLYFATCMKPAVDAKIQCLHHCVKLGNGMDKRGEKDIDDTDISTTAGDPTSSSMEKGQFPKRIAVVKQELYNAKTPESGLRGWEDGEGINHQVTIDWLINILAEFFQELEQLTGWSFSVLMGGPTPALGGKIEVSSFHVGHTKMGNLFSEAYPDFNKTIMKPWVEFINCAHSKGLKKDESMNNINNEMVMENPAMAMSDSSNVTATLLPPLDESDELNLLANAFLSSPGYSQLHLSSLQPQLPLTSPFLSSNPYSSINSYDDFSWISSASQPPAETSGPGKAYTTGPILPQPLPQTYPSPPPFVCAPTPSTITLESTLPQSILPTEPVSNPPSLTEFLQDLMKKQVSMESRHEMSQDMPLPQSLPGVPPSEIPPSGVIHAQTPLLPEDSAASLTQNLFPPSQNVLPPTRCSAAAPAQSSPPPSTMNSTSPSAVSILMLLPVEQSTDSPDVTPTCVPPPHTSKRHRHHDSNKSEVSDGLVTGHSKRVHVGSKRNDITNTIRQDTTRSATQSSAPEPEH
ncbi:uncharacterized protein EDB91DRAFT_1253064 [Suillus paluster]|uniref:uncharacterized protein n=1 Tax=Suillus paluster TaxID=48578 RepID=UPI001B881ADD|nr:uncharacterized protein EDB91DRAFT_1253064 [Suillus paluster]KAG1729319.1 hypothetical protein EDB91DRAFT_1253064 [Suillus paluster]